MMKARAPEMQRKRRSVAGSLLSRQRVNVRDVPVSYEVAGAGEPLVLVHGFSESTRLWYRNVPELAEQYRVYLVDLPGFGTMRRFHRHFNLADMGAWLRAWLEVLDLENVALVGHSMGGYAAMALAAASPARIRRLVLVDSLGIPLELSVARLMGPALKAIAHASPSPWRTMSYDALRAGPFTLLRVARQIVALDASATLAAVQVPTLLIWGDHDDLVPCALGHQLHTRLSGARLLVLPGANHFCMYEQPHLFNQAVLDFLQGRNIGLDISS